MFHVAPVRPPSSTSQPATTPTAQHTVKADAAYIPDSDELIVGIHEPGVAQRSLFCHRTQHARLVVPSLDPGTLPPIRVG